MFHGGKILLIGTVRWISARILPRPRPDLIVPTPVEVQCTAQYTHDVCEIAAAETDYFPFVYTVQGYQIIDGTCNLQFNII